MNWINIKDKTPELGRRILTCDNREEDPIKMYRIMDAQFVKICGDVTHWMYLEKPVEEIVYYRGGRKYRKLKREEIIRKGDLFSFDVRGLKKLQDPTYTGRVPNEFPPEMDFYTSI